MREDYHQNLVRLADDLGVMCEMVAAAMEKATTALLDADLAAAEEVIADDRNVDGMRAQCEERAHSLLALQAPVATDLRTVLAGIHAAESLERMGDLALHVARSARRRHPDKVVPDEVAPYFQEMGSVVVDLARQAKAVIKTRDVAEANRIEEADDAVDDIHRHLFTVIMDRDWPHGVAAAVDTTLLGRFYERYGDHAVSVAKRMIFVATGVMPGHSVV